MLNRRHSARDAYRAAILAINPVSYWRLGETSGTRALDEMGANNGVYQPNSGGAWTGGTQGVAGVVAGNAGANFNGSNGYVDIAHSSSLDFTSMTVEAWVNTSSLLVQPVVAKVGSDYASGWELDNSSGAIRATLRGSSLNVTGPSVPTGWNYYAFTYNAVSKILILYLNGIQVGQATGIVTLNSSVNLQIARRVSDGELLKGSIDEVAIYNRALNATEIAAHFAAAQ